MDLKIAFIGFGNVAREFARLLESRKAILEEQYGMRWRTRGIATQRHGSVILDSDLDLPEALRCVENGHQLVSLKGATAVSDAVSLIQVCDADIIFETTPLSPMDGEPAATYLRRTLQRSISVITANKGPIACAYRELKELAAARQCHFRFEGAVMDGAPIFNLLEYCLPATRVLSLAGVLNSTTNMILSGLETGRPFNECLEEARRLGIAEAESDYDLDGWDTAVKAVALANVFMNGEVRPQEVSPCGIRSVTPEAIRQARNQGKTIRLIGRAQADDGRIKVTVAPEEVDDGSLFAGLRGTSSALTIKTDLMGELTMVEHQPFLQQTAYALLSDMLRVHEELNR
jgi:homoserine dehydrogenase